jgi:NADH pyrophosphatase NudC (nudix superfamily)
VIQAQMRSLRQPGSHPSSSHGSSSGAPSSMMPGIVACTSCNSRFAEGVKFCGRCGNRSFVLVSAGESGNSFPCPRCSTPLPENSRFCGRCGLNIVPRATSSGPVTSLPPQAERLCRRCGGAYPPHIRFCGKCGHTMT